MRRSVYETLRSTQPTPSPSLSTQSNTSDPAPPIILLVDPVQMALSYNYCLLDGLAKEGATMVYACAQFAHEDVPIPPGVKGLRCFFCVASIVQRFTVWRPLRRVLRMAEYPLNVLFLMIYARWHRIPTVHLMWSLAPTVDVIWMRLLKWSGCRVIYTAHNAFPHERKPHHVQAYSRLYREADHLIVLTEYTAREIRSTCDISDERISVIPHGDFSAMHAAFPCDDDLVADVFRKANGRKIIAFLGIIRPYKGLDYFIEAIPRIQQQMPDAFFLVAGSIGLGDEGAIRANIAAHCRKEDIWVDIRYLPTSALKAYVKAMDVLVLPYISASQSGNTVMAYAAGVPVVATDVGGLAEMTTDGETGFVIPPRDSQAIADAVCRCFEGDRYNALSSCAKQAADHEFSWTSIAQKTLAVYHSKTRRASDRNPPKPNETG